MNERTLNKDLPASVGKSVKIDGWVDVRRDHGKLIFLDIRDRSGTVQVVVTPRAAEALEKAKELRAEWVVEIEGEVKVRPENMRGEGELGSVELVASAITVLSKSHELPFELGTELNLDTHLDNLPLTLRTKRSRDIFTMQATILDGYRKSLAAQGFIEFVAPSLVGSDSEGGGAVFKVEYFNEVVAYLAVSPQLYKQIMVGPFERAFTVAKIFRAERSATTRHLSEATCIDFEMGFIENEREPMKVLECAIRDTVNDVADKHEAVFARFGTRIPLVSDEIPVLTLKEAFETLGKPEAPDLEPEDERNISAWAKANRGSDFVFITRFPTKKRAFYTYEDPQEAPYSRGFDLLFRGLEINSGAQRIHDYDMLVERMKSRGLDPQKFSYYLQAFKYGLPPHGGSSTGLERFTARMLELPNVKEATAFPRDMHRIDVRLSTFDEVGIGEDVQIERKDS